MTTPTSESATREAAAALDGVETTRPAAAVRAGERTTLPTDPATGITGAQSLVRSLEAVGTESMWASARGVTRFVAPGPEVAMQTPTRPVAAAYPCAAWPAPCSWRTSTCRMRVESISGSYAGRIAPPGMPKMSVTPAASREVMRLCAPLT